MVGKGASTTVNLILGLAVLGLGVAGVMWISGANNRRRQRLITDFVGFDPNYYRKAGHSMGHTRAKILADKMYSSVGYFNDNEEAMLSVLKEARTAGNLSLISHYFNIRHGDSLGGWTADYLDRKSETKQVLDALKNLEL